MSRYTKEDIFRIVEEEDVEFIRLQFTDIFGTLKNVAITSSQLEKALNNKCMFDGSSIGRHGKMVNVSRSAVIFIVQTKHRLRGTPVIS